MHPDEPVSRYPLQWPHGWTRTPAPDRRRAGHFNTYRSTPALTGVTPGLGGSTRERRAVSIADAVKRLSGELARLGATHEILSSNLQTRLDGLPRGGQTDPADPGVAVYFKLNGKSRCLACDRWIRVADNIAALAQHIDALRRIERYGVGTMEQAFAGYAALPPDAATDWWIILGVTPTATTRDIEEAFRAKARFAHPDRGGRPEEMARLNTARDAARRERGVA